MVRVIDWHDREAYSQTVEQIHRLRKEVFIDHYKWDLAHENGLEIDQFDQPEALYLFDQDPQTGMIVSSMRLLPTTGVHMMEPLFAHLCAADYPRGPHVLEVSRLLYNPRIQGESMSTILRIRHRLLLGMLEFCAQWGVQDLIFVTHAKFLARLVSYDWDIRPLGLPAMDGQQQISAMHLLLTPDTLPRLQNQFNQFDPVLQNCPAIPRKAA